MDTLTIYFRLGRGNLGVSVSRDFIYRVFAYLITRGRGIAERNVEQGQQARNELRRVVGFSPANESKSGKESRSISGAEYARLRTQVVQ